MTIKPVADLYLIKYEDGRLYKCTCDAEEAVDAISFGFEVEEFVSLDHHRAAMLQGAENVESRYTIQTAPALDSSPKNAESRCGKTPVILDGLIAAVNRLLDSDGSRGCYSANRCYDAHKEVERLLAAAPQQEVKS